jgi:5-methylcytosine-specific restriction endonuclease McrA
MQRRHPLRRSPFRRRTPDITSVIGRSAATRIEWQAIQSQVRSRAGWRCQACGRRGRLDVHHVIKRSRGGSDFDLDRLIALCRACHDQTGAPLAAGRLIVTPLGDGRFAFDVAQGPAKYRWPEGRPIIR